jgi:hypothetical protein
MEVAPPASRVGGATKVAAAKHLSALAPLTADGVDKIDRQLAEIHAITAAQLEECAHWCWFDPVSSLVSAGAGRQRPTATFSVAVLAPPPPMDFTSQASLWR